jgi:anaerobic ribonucleoside-triphosphate reductase activating protein
MAYSGWTLEELRAKPECQNLLREIDVLVDGRFIIARKTLQCRFRGSSNQRLYHLKQGEIISVE